MKQRLKNWITSSFGTLLMVASITLFILGLFDVLEFGWLPFVLMASLGWVFLAAKDTLLEGITAKIWKINSDD